MAIGRINNFAVDFNFAYVRRKVAFFSSVFTRLLDLHFRSEEVGPGQGSVHGPICLSQIMQTDKGHHTLRDRRKHGNMLCKKPCAPARCM